MIDQILTQLHTISIHALHEESDFSVVTWHTITTISIHALHEESDNQLRCTMIDVM